MKPDSYAFGPFVLYPGRELLREGSAVTLGSRALILLEAIVEANGAVVTKDDLLGRVWPHMTVEEGNLSVQVAALRKQLGLRTDGRDWVATVPRVGYRFVGNASPLHSATESTHGVNGKPVVAVLPFVNLSGDLSRDYFTDGVVEDLITALSRFKTFAVVARNSSFAYKNRVADVRQVAQELGVSYLLEGSARIAGDRVRITVQLVDATSGTHCWAESFDGDLAQTFEFQDRVTERVVGLVEPQIRRAEIERSRRRWPENPQAYDYFLRALPHFYGRAPDRFVQALTHLDRAIALEPDYAVAMAYASWAYARRGTLTMTLLDPDEAERCIDLARAAISYGGEDPQVEAICSHSLIAIGHMNDEGLARVRRARQDNPNNVVVLNQCGVCNMLVGDLEESEAAFRRAYELSPRGLEAHETLSGQGFARFFMRDFEGASELLRQSLATFVDWPPTYWILAASLAHLGRPDEARVVVSRLKAIAPHSSLEGLRIVGLRSDARWQTLMDGLVKAGLD